MGSLNLNYVLVESNDTLYGSDAKFISEIDKMSSIILGELLSQLKQLGPSRKQATIALELMVRIATLTDLGNNNINGLAINLWQLCLKYGNIDKKYMVSEMLCTIKKLN